MGLYRRIILRRGLGALPSPPDKHTAARSFTTYVPTQPDRRQMWACGRTLDQRQEGACVGFAWTADLIAAPYPDPVSKKTGERYGFNHWRRARELAGHPPGDGTTLWSGAQVAIERGLITDATRPASMLELRDHMIGVGPAVIAVPWLPGMDRTTAAGEVRIKWPTGDRDYSRHAMCLTGYHPAKRLGGRTGPAYRVRNSWGRWWGSVDTDRARRNTWPKPRTGDGWIWADDLERLLRWGYEPRLEAYLPIGRSAVDLRTQLAAHPDPAS